MVSMSVIDEYLENNDRYASTYSGGAPAPPSRQLAVVACMDARMDVHALLGLRIGEAHVIRNAGGVVTADTIRSLVISQRKLGTREVMLIHHTECGLQTFTDDEFRRELLEETGLAPEWAVEAFPDVDEDVRQSLRRIRVNPFLPHTDAVRGFVFDIVTGRLREVV